MPRPKKTSLKRSPGRRISSTFGCAMLIRIFHLHQRLCRQAPVTTKVLAQENECSERTIMRDVEKMRDRLGAPIEWDPAANTYRYSRPCDTLPMVKLEHTETLALSLVAKAVDATHAPGLGDSVASALAKLTPLLGGAVSFPLASLRSVIAAPLAIERDEFRHFEPLVKAALQRRATRLLYAKPEAHAAESHLVHPLLLAQLGDRWTLIAHDPAKSALRHFLLVRLREVEVTATLFKPPSGFDADAHLAGCIGRYAGNEKHEVRIALRGAAAAHARDSAWHSSQRNTTLPDGRTEIALQLNNLVDILQIVLRCGDQAEVLSPAPLREKVRQTLAAALRVYESDGASSEATSPSAAD